jgi:biopolymer transport protein ExbD
MVIPRLPLVAFIDVVLFLLLYFVFASDLAPEEGQLPSAIQAETRGGRGTPLSPQVLRVEAKDGKPRYVLGERVMSDRESLRAVLAQLPKEAGLVVRVAPDATVEAAAVGVSAARRAGFVKVSYVPGS